MADEVVEIVHLDVVRLQQIVDGFRSLLLVLEADVLVCIHSLVGEAGLRSAPFRDFLDELVNWQFLQRIDVELKVSGWTWLNLILVVLPILSFIIILVKLLRLSVAALAVDLHESSLDRWVLQNLFD